MDKKTYGLLKLLKSRNSLTLEEMAAIINCNAFNLSDPVHYLLKNKYIRQIRGIENIEDDTLYLDSHLKITYDGELAMRKYKHDKWHFRFSEFRAWATLVIALCALVLSVINMLTH